MSLIPNESHSFPDDFSRAISRARVLHEQEKFAALHKGRQQQPARVVARPAPVPASPPSKPTARPIPAAAPPPARPVVPKVVPTARPAVQPVPAPPPAPPVRPAPVTPVPIMQAPPPADASPRPAIPRKPLLRNGPSPVVATKPKNRAPGVQPLGQVRLPKSVRVSPELVVAAPPQAPPSTPAQLVPRDEAEQAELEFAPESPRRRRPSAKFKRFLRVEVPAVGALLIFAALGLAHPFNNPVAVVLVNIVTIAVAVVVAVIPIFFFALTPTLPSRED
jgi:hypothetical protein